MSNDSLLQEVVTAARAIASTNKPTAQLKGLSSLAPQITRPILQLSKTGLPTSENPLATLEREGISAKHITEEVEAIKTISLLAKVKGTIGIAINVSLLSQFAKKKISPALNSHNTEILNILFYAGGKNVYVFEKNSFSTFGIFAPLQNSFLVAHDALFEMTYFRKAGFNPSRLYCSALLYCAVNGVWMQSEGVDLEKVQAELLGWSKRSDQATKAVASYKIFESLYPKLSKDKGRLKGYHYAVDCLPVVADMQICGLNYDSILHAQLIDEWKQELALLRKELLKIMPGVDPEKPQQLSRWLHKHMPPEIAKRWPKTKNTQQLQTKADTFEAMASANPSMKVLTLIARYRRTSKNLNSFGKGLLEYVNIVTGLLHGNFTIWGARTGRFTCKNPNLLGFPRDPTFRAIFTAPNEYQIVVADLSQIELRILAIVTKDPELLAAFERGEDIHSLNASILLNKPLNEITKADRNKSKGASFGIAYGMGAPGLITFAKSTYNVDVSFDEARQMINNFYARYSFVKKWKEQVSGEAKITKSVCIPGDKLRDFTREELEEGESLYTKAVNSPIQGSATFVLMAGIRRLHDALQDIDAQLCNIIHDEVVLIAHSSQADTVRTLVEQNLTRGMQDIFPTASTKNLVTAGVGNSWASAKADAERREKLLEVKI